MPRKRSRNAHLDYAYFKVTVSASSAYMSCQIPDPKYDAVRDAASSYITIEGALNAPVIRRQAALVHVHCREQDDPHVGAALGVNDTHRQVVVNLPRAQFADLLTLIAVQGIVRVQLVTDALRRGGGRIRSVGFHTAPVPSEAYLDDE